MSRRFQRVAETGQVTRLARGAQSGGDALAVDRGQAGDGFRDLLDGLGDIPGVELADGSSQVTQQTSLSKLPGHRMGISLEVLTGIRPDLCHRKVSLLLEFGDCGVLTDGPQQSRELQSYLVHARRVEGGVFEAVGRRLEDVGRPLTPGGGFGPLEHGEYAGGKNQRHRHGRDDQDACNDRESLDVPGNERRGRGPLKKLHHFGLERAIKRVLRTGGFELHRGRELLPPVGKTFDATGGIQGGRAEEKHAHHDRGDATSGQKKEERRRCAGEENEEGPGTRRDRESAQRRVENPRQCEFTRSGSERASDVRHGCP